MVKRYLIDTSAWIDYLNGIERAKLIDEIIDDRESEIYCSVISIAEIASKCLRQLKSKEEVLQNIENISSISIVLSIDKEISLIAGLKQAEVRATNKDFSLANAFIWIQAEQKKCKLITCDSDFKKFPEVVILK